MSPAVIGPLPGYLGHRVGLIDVSALWCKLRDVLPQIDELVAEADATKADAGEPDAADSR
jgi:hypothetical protein